MPTYEYVCDACKHAWEEFQSISAEALKKCPHCKKNKARRQISAGGGIIFKGSGFYQTDYRTESYKQGADAESKSSAPASSASEGTAETKSESKPESKPTSTKSNTTDK